MWTISGARIGSSELIDAGVSFGRKIVATLTLKTCLPPKLFMSNSPEPLPLGCMEANILEKEIQRFLRPSEVPLCCACSDFLKRDGKEARHATMMAVQSIDCELDSIAVGSYKASSKK